MKKKIAFISIVVIISLSAMVFFNKIQQRYIYENTTQGEKASEKEVSHEEDKKENLGEKKSENPNEIKDQQGTNTLEGKKEEDKAKASSSESNKANNNNVEKAKESTPVAKPEEKKPPVSNEEKKQESNIFIINGITGTTLASSYIECENKTVEEVTLLLIKNSSMEYVANGGYFSSIGGLKERSAGKASGWCYYVNGTKPGVGARSYVLKKGDKVEWKFLADGLIN